jgi:hypothetical protein
MKNIFAFHSEKISVSLCLINHDSSTYVVREFEAQDIPHIIRHISIQISDLFFARNRKIVRHFEQAVLYINSPGPILTLIFCFKMFNWYKALLYVHMIKLCFYSFFKYSTKTIRRQNPKNSKSAIRLGSLKNL